LARKVAMAVSPRKRLLATRKNEREHRDRDVAIWSDGPAARGDARVVG
jgi:hypothetical protein